MATLTNRNQQLPSLTGIRGYAAVFVMIAHGCALLIKFNDYQHPLVPWLTSLAGIGMSLFFVLSGFVIHYNYASLISEGGKPGIIKFFKARFARLYPLFFLMLLVDLAWGISPGWHRITHNGTWLWYEAMPFYIPMIQTWVYGVIGANSLVYQIGPNVPLTWSISTEWFFYCAYPVILLLLIRLRKPLLIGIIIALYSFAIWMLFRDAVNFYPALDAWGLSHFGPVAGMPPFQDSFVRWVFYFSPYSRITEFILGCLACHLFIQLRHIPVSRVENITGACLQWAALLGALFFYREFFIIKTIGVVLPMVFGLAPMMAILIFVFARYQSKLNYLFENRIAIWAGEISYSVYLTHYLIFHALSQFTRPDFTTANEIIEWSRFCFGVGIILLISSLSYRFFEVPMRALLRDMTFQRLKFPTFHLQIFSRVGASVLVIYLLLKLLTWPGLNDNLSALIYPWVQNLTGA